MFEIPEIVTLARQMNDQLTGSQVVSRRAISARPANWSLRKGT